MRWLVLVLLVWCVAGSNYTVEHVFNQSSILTTEWVELNFVATMSEDIINTTTVITDLLNRMYNAQLDPAYDFGGDPAPLALFINDCVMPLRDINVSTSYTVAERDLQDNATLDVDGTNDNVTRRFVMTTDLEKLNPIDYATFYNFTSCIAELYSPPGISMTLDCIARKFTNRSIVVASSPMRKINYHKETLFNMVEVENEKGRGNSPANFGSITSQLTDWMKEMVVNDLIITRNLRDMILQAEIAFAGSAAHSPYPPLHCFPVNQSFTEAYGSNFLID